MMMMMILFSFQQHSLGMHQRMVRATQLNSLGANSTSFLLSYGPNRPELNSIDYKVDGVYSSKNMSGKSTNLKNKAATG